MTRNTQPTQCKECTTTFQFCNMKKHINSKKHKMTCLINIDVKKIQEMQSNPNFKIHYDENGDIVEEKHDEEFYYSDDDDDNIVDDIVDDDNNDACKHCGWRCEYEQCHILYEVECKVIRDKYIITFEEEDGYIKAVQKNDTTKVFIIDF